MRKIPLVLIAVALAGCQGKDKAPDKPTAQVQGKAAAAAPDNGVIPKNLEIPYQVLFQCRIELAQKEGKTYVPDPDTSRSVRDAVAKNPAAGDECMKKLRGGATAVTEDKPEAKPTAAQADTQAK